MLIRELIALLTEQDPEAAILVGYEGICKAVGSVTEAWTGSGAVRPPFVLTADEDVWWEDTMEMLPGPPPPTEEELRAKLLDDIDEWNALLQKAREAGPPPEKSPVTVSMNPYLTGSGDILVDVHPEQVGPIQEHMIEFISMHLSQCMTVSTSMQFYCGLGD